MLAVITEMVVLSVIIVLMAVKFFNMGYNSAIDEFKEAADANKESDS